MIKKTIILVSIALIIPTLSLAQFRMDYSQLVLSKSVVIPISVSQPTDTQYTGKCSYDPVKKLVKCYVTNGKGTHDITMRYITKVTLPDNSYANITIKCPLIPVTPPLALDVGHPGPYVIDGVCSFNATGTFRQKYSLYKERIKKARFDVNFTEKK